MKESWYIYTENPVTRDCIVSELPSQEPDLRMCDDKKERKVWDIGNNHSIITSLKNKAKLNINIKYAVYKGRSHGTLKLSFIHHSQKKKKAIKPTKK